MNTTRTITRIGVGALLALAFLGSTAFAQGAFSHVLSFQGRLSASDGKPLPDGPYIVVFRMYGAESGGTVLWTETQGITQVGGTFTAFLGMVTTFPPAMFTGGDRWLAIQVGSDPEMPTRVRLTPSPWAIRAETADQAANADTLDNQHGSYYLNASNITLGTLMDARLSGNVALLNVPQTFSADKSFTGNVNVGTTSSTSRLTVMDNSASNPALTATHFGATNDQPAIRGVNVVTDGHGIGVEGIGGLFGVNGDVTAMGTGSYTGVRGAAHGGTGTNCGLYGMASGGGTAFGVYGTASGAANNYAGFFNGSVVVTGALSANGSGLTNLNAGYLSSGTVPDGRLGGTYSQSVTFSNPGNRFMGDGLGLTNLNAGNIINGALPSEQLSGTYSYMLSFTNTNNSFTGDGSGLRFLNASNITGGALSDTRLSGNVALLDTVQTFSADKSFAGNVGIGTVTQGYPLTFADTLGDKISLHGQTGDHHGFGVQANELQIIARGIGDHISLGYGRSSAFHEVMRVSGYQLVTITGDLIVNGQITKAFTTGTLNQATPLAYATINADGSMASGTPNVTSYWDSVWNRYVITIAGETYNDSGYQTLITIVSANVDPPVGATSASIDGKLVVRFRNASLVLGAQAKFSFLTYKP